MCDPVTIGLALSAVGAAGSAYQQSQVAHAQDNSNALAIMHQSDAHQKASAALQAGIQQVAGSNPNQQTQTNDAAYKAQVAEAEKAAMNNGSVAHSAAFTAAQKEAGAGVSTYGDKLAQFMAGIDAAGQQRVNESGTLTGTRGQVGTINSDQAAQNMADNVRTASIHANPMWKAMFGLAQGAGSAMSGYGAWAKAAKQAALSDMVNNYANTAKNLSTNLWSTYSPAMSGSGSSTANIG